MTMKHSREVPGSGHLFSRLIDNSRRLFGLSKVEKKEELDAISRLIEHRIIPRLRMRFSTAQDLARADTQV
jgi:hypothetical protein